MARSLIIPIPDEVEPYTDDIRRFVHAMVYKLKVHHRKGRWNGKTVEEYLPLLDGEVAELKEAVNDGNLIEILTEAADCGNMALILAAIAIERGANAGLEQSDRSDTARDTDMGERGAVRGRVEGQASNGDKPAPPVVLDGEDGERLDGDSAMGQAPPRYVER